MILTGPEIQKQLEAGRISIDPFNPKCLNPGSYDLTLGNEVVVYEGVVFCYGEAGTEEDGGYFLPNPGAVLDTKQELPARKFTINPEVGWLLKPGIGYLMATAEKVHTDYYVPVIDGKSSLGRLFVQVHITAGYGDIGYSGHYTLEVVVTHPVRVYPGMRFCQMRFHQPQGDLMNYASKGHYTGEAATGPVPSKARKSAFNL